jgi:hypothetical protein
MPVRIKSVATIAAALAIALAAPAAFAADQMSNSHDSGSGATTMDKGMDPAKPHSGGDSMSHPGTGKMSGRSQTTSGTSGDTSMSHDKMTH